MANLINLKKLKRNSRIAGFVALTTLVASATAYFNHIKDKYLQFAYTLDTEPEHYKLFSDLFHEYGCQTKADFQMFLAENSYQTQGWQLVDGVFKPTIVTKYNEVASVANERYQTYMDTIVNYFIQDPNAYLELDPAITTLAVGAPIVVTLIWIMQHHKYKKALKESERLNQESVEQAEQAQDKKQNKGKNSKKNKECTGIMEVIDIEDENLNSSNSNMSETLEDENDLTKQN